MGSPSSAPGPAATGGARLVLGTVQLGLPYGIANRSGQPDREQACAILRTAIAGGIHTYDTAAQYGSSEETLGSCHSELQPHRIVTKTVAIDPAADAAAAARAVTEGLQQSLRRLQRTQLYGLLVHNAADLLGPHGPAIWQALESLRRTGLVARLGVSVYTPDQARTLTERYPLQLVQLPLNALDQRCLPLLPWLRERGIEIHARSAFLQGLLLMEPEQVPAYFASIAPQLDALRAMPGTALERALRFALQQDVDGVLIGVETVTQLQSILRCAQSLDLCRAENWHACAVNDEAYINPARWPKA